MAKGDDVVAKKKNKANRKKLRRDGSATVSARIAGIIAAKKRRKSGKRSMCQGMCFSLPTPEDPFNERYNKKDNLANETKKRARPQSREAVDRKASESGNGYSRKSDELRKNDCNGQVEKTASVGNLREDHPLKDLGCPSKFLILCLKNIQDSLCSGDSENVEKVTPFFVNAWGLKFWKLYAAGSDIAESTGTCSPVEQVAWVVSSAADTITRREKEGQSFSSPFLLYLVQSKEKASEVRKICKPLKALGIHTVSIHAGADLDHQIEGLKSCEPEFLVSTPERLFELISLKAIDISGISLLVVDASLTEGSSDDMINSIKSFISGDHRTILFCNSPDRIRTIRTILERPTERLSCDDSVASSVVK